MSEKIQTLLGFDFGTHKIGVAIGQTLTRSATPLCILKAIDGEPNWREVENLLDEWSPSLFIVGLPLHDDHSDNEMSLKARAFAKILSEKFRKPHSFVNETLSTFAVKHDKKEQKLQAAPSRKKQQKFKKSDKALDDYSAALILQSWMQIQAKHVQTPPPNVQADNVQIENVQTNDSSPE